LLIKYISPVLFIEKIKVYNYSSGWISSNKMKKLEEEFKGDDVDEVLSHMKNRMKKDNSFITYALYFKNGYFRAIEFNRKENTWALRSDNETGIRVSGKEDAEILWDL